MDEGILEVSELAGDRVVELRGVGLRVVGLITCECEGDVIAVVAPLGGVAQVVSHGVKVVGVHGEEGQEKKRGSAGGSKRRSRATQRETLIMDGVRME